MYFISCVKFADLNFNHCIWLCLCLYTRNSSIYLQHW